MRKIYVLFLLFSAAASFAQDQHCATDVVMQRVYEKNPALKLQQRQRNEEGRQLNQRASAVNSFTIPVVFHIMHVNGDENISDAQVIDGLRILNRNFSKRNADTVEIIDDFKDIADSTNIYFALPTKDPFDNCTSGIIHYYDQDADWDDSSPTIFSHTWDPTRYMNVYIVRSITLTGGFGASGYTYFPGTWPTGHSFDAIVVLNNYFGSVGTGDNFLSRVLTHETGHWLNLFHVFGGAIGSVSDCSGDDFVNDTPPTSGHVSCPNPAVPAQYQTCTPGVSENFQNYMDYSYCCRMFTQQQAQRMQAALQSPVNGRNNLWSNANLVSTGVITPTAPCLPIADFKFSRSKVCAGTAVTFYDATWNGQPTSYSWNFPGGTPATSTASAPVVTYATPGLYSVTYSSSNSAGAAVPVTKTNAITVTNNTAAYQNGWSESFENFSTLNSDWNLVTSNSGSRWERTTAAAYTGNFSMKIAPEKNTRKTVTEMISPALNLTFQNSSYLNFKVAAAEVTPNHVNSLKVYSSFDCGSTWSQIYAKAGTSLITSNSSAANFVPFNTGEWRSESISLQPLASKTFVNFKFEYTRDTIAGANTIYIDDINISNTPVSLRENAAALESLTIFPVPSNGSVEVSFRLLQSQQVQFSLVDLWGRELEKYTEAGLSPGEHVQLINAEQKLVAGVYFLNVQAGNTTYTRKIIIGQ